MIVKLLSSGSFRGLSHYLLHDPGRKTSDRVAWTQSLNCAFDDPAAVVAEMEATYRDAELLKQEAGVRAGGAKLEKPAKHVSLGWHVSERPDRDEMMEAVESYLNHQGWLADHQALVVAHDDREHSHVHILLSKVSQETGLALDDSFERV